MRQVASKMLQLMLLLSFALLVSCGGDDKDNNSTGPNGSTELSKLVGTWECIEFTYTNNNNPSQVFDFLAANNASITITVASDGNYTVRITAMGTTFTETGRFVEVNGEVTIEDEEGVTVTITDNRFTWIDPDEEWDFDNDGTMESATLKVVFQKQ
jgi:hypothetical protein